MTGSGDRVTAVKTRHYPGIPETSPPRLPELIDSKASKLASPPFQNDLVLEGGWVLSVSTLLTTVDCRFACHSAFPFLRIGLCTVEVGSSIEACRSTSKH